MSKGLQSIDSKQPLNIAIVNCDNTLTSALFGIMDIFAIYNKDCVDENARKVETTIVRSGAEKIAFNPTATIKDRPIDSGDDFDIVIIPPMINLGHELSENDALIRWLQQMYQQGTLLVSVCVGVYILAQAGLLNGKKVTTHWMIEDKLQQEFPQIRVDTSKILIEDNNIVTAGGVSAYIDMCLYIIRRFASIEAAYHCANVLIVDAGRSSQLHYKNLSMIFTNGDDDVQRAIDYLQEHYGNKIKVEDIAKHLGLNERTFLRKFKKATGFLPTAYLQNLRIEKAKEMLILSDQKFEAITHRVGYNNVSTFRNLFRKSTGLNPKNYRDRFRIND